MKDEKGKGAADEAKAAHHEHEPFDPEPTCELGAGEPRTPTWLPVLGAALFVLGGIWWLRGDEAPTGTGAAGFASAGSASAAPAGSAPLTGTPGYRPAESAQPGQMTPETRERIRRNLERLRGGQPAAPGAGQ